MVPASGLISVGYGLIMDVSLPPLPPPPTGRTTLGNGPADISIQGPGVAPQHCYIENKGGVITLHPCGNPCAVDGLQLTQPVRLSQGRRPPSIADQLPAGSIHRLVSTKNRLVRASASDPKPCGGSWVGGADVNGASSARLGLFPKRSFPHV